MSNVIPNITVDDPYHRRVNDEIIAFGQVMDDAAYRALVSVPLLEVSAAVTFSQECPSNGKVCPVRIKANVNVGGPVKLDLFLRRPEAYLYNIVVVGEDRQAKGVGRSVLMRVLANIAPLGFTIVSARATRFPKGTRESPRKMLVTMHWRLGVSMRISQPISWRLFLGYQPNSWAPLGCRN